MATGGEELNAEQMDKLLQFQDLTGIEDFDRCKSILISHQWNLESAVEDRFTDPSPPPPPPMLPPSLSTTHYNNNTLPTNRFLRQRRERPPLVNVSPPDQRSMVDYILVLVRAKHRKYVKNVKAIPGMLQHSMVVMDVTSKEMGRRKKDKVLLKLPNGMRLERRFDRHESIQHLHDFLFVHESAPDDFEIIRSHPRITLPCRKRLNAFIATTTTTSSEDTAGCPSSSSGGGNGGSVGVAGGSDLNLIDECPTFDELGFGKSELLYVYLGLRSMKRERWSLYIGVTMASLLIFFFASGHKSVLKLNFFATPNIFETFSEKSSHIVSDTSSFRISKLKQSAVYCEDLVDDWTAYNMSNIYYELLPAFQESCNTAKGSLSESEGHSGQVPEQRMVMHYLASTPSIRTICETGFNYGHSSFNFLTSNLKASVYSFDLGSHKYARKMAELLPGLLNLKGLQGERLTVRFGDSTVEVPKAISEGKLPLCDLMFVDGGHTYPIARADLLNFARHSNEDNLIIFDDYPTDWGKAIGRAWQELLISKERADEHMAGGDFLAIELIYQINRARLEAPQKIILEFIEYFAVESPLNILQSPKFQIEQKRKQDMDQVRSERNVSIVEWFSCTKKNIQHSFQRGFSVGRVILT
ncbi:hypothetical protein HELRODRAFT_192900 [Helobdella robusta]|uniref:UBX domain-containing protein n=1 Tax=Helobdella robusta TaxID=6412 RepID=T1FUE4_HELRO|nr:hypothetical protein HELRODRAFT_192900 [Helobdella robusta]ESN98381.1 hypothetical protein HELRODRAFT_192900 [Helobdella robusta]